MDKAKESVAGPITVAVIRRGGQPAMNAKVTIQGPDGQTVPGIKIDSEGRIVLPNSIPGEYLLKAYVDGAPKDVTQTINPRSLTQPIIIDFPGGQEQISIRAIDSYKNPVPGATVTLTAVKQGKKIVDRQPLPLTGQAMELGDYTVQIEAENYISYGKHITISHEPATRDLTFELREDFLAQARRAYAAGDYQQALDLAANVPAVEQLEYIEAQILSGRCCARLQQFDEAVMFDRRALALNKKNPEVYFNLGLALFNLWNYGEAYDAFRGTVEQIRYVKDSANAGKLEADAYVYMAICKARLWEAMGKSEKDCPGCQAEAIRNLELFDQMAEQSPVLRHDENMQKHYNDARRIVAEKPGA